MICWEMENFKSILHKHNDIKDELLIDGVEALAMGAIAGGCNFLSFYPMSPSTAVAVLLAQHSKEFGIIVEQAEDEISAMNMVIGAWYAGARGLASTSGGGFALMVEGLSLAGMIESPVGGPHRSAAWPSNRTADKDRTRRTPFCPLLGSRRIPEDHLCPWNDRRLFLFGSEGL